MSMETFNKERVFNTYSDNVNKEIAFDLKYGVNTKTPTKVSKAGTLIMDHHDNSDKYPVSNGYQSCPEEYIDLIQEQLGYQLLDSFENFDFIDIGSGYGKVIFYLLTKEKHFKSYSGIEIDEEYHDIAKNNYKNFAISTDVPVNFYNEDALAYNFNFNNSVLFLANPFTSENLEPFIEKIIPSIIESNCFLVTVGVDTQNFHKDLQCVYAFDSLQIWKAPFNAN